ncbi:MAG TPA: ISAs1 family transposase [Pirellulales bacterium]|jgi:hypothetical protein|nr:ISAs1 family transposase [Pirellulales bacterium]
MDADGKSFVAGLRNYFVELRDPRVQGRCAHLRIDVLAIALLAVMCGAEDWPDLQEFGKRRRAWLKTFLSLPGGIPSHDTFRRVLGMLDRKQFAACLFQWTQALHEATGGKVIAVAGKTARRCFGLSEGDCRADPRAAGSLRSGAEGKPIRSARGYAPIVRGITSTRISPG